MGCDGCELWLGPEKVASNLVATAVGAGLPMPVVRKVVSSRLGGLGLSELVSGREKILSSIQSDLVCDDCLRANMGSVIKRAGACYAGRLHVLRAGHPGFADEFVQPKMFTGRMATQTFFGALDDVMDVAQARAETIRLGAGEAMLRWFVMPHLAELMAGDW